MLQKVSERVRECLQRADESAERAKRERNPSIQRDFLEMQDRWLKLAQSYQFLEQLETFTTHNQKGQTELSRRLDQLVRNAAKDK